MPFWKTDADATAVRSDRSDATRRARRLIQSWASSTNTRAGNTTMSDLEVRAARAIRSALRRGREVDASADKTVAARSDRSDATRRARRLVKSTDIRVSRAAMSDLETRVARAIRSALKRGRGV